LQQTAKDKQLTVRIKKIAGSAVDTKAAAAKLASNVSAVTAMAAFVASAKKINNVPAATAKGAGKPAGARTKFRKVNGPQSVFTCGDNSDCGYNSSSKLNTSRGICNLNGFHSAFIKSCVCGHNATGTFVGYSCKQFRPFSNKPFFPDMKTAKSANNTLAFSVSGVSYTTKAAYRITNISNASYTVTFPVGTTFPTTVDIGFTLIEKQQIPSYQVEQGVRSLGGNHIKLLPAGFSFASGSIQISMKIDSPCTAEPGTKHVVMKLISTGGWQAQPTTSNIQVDYSTCMLSFTTSSFSVYGAFNIPLSPSNASGLSAGAIVGIVIGSVFAVALVAAAIYVRHRRKQNALPSSEPITSSHSVSKADDASSKLAEHPAKAAPDAATKTADGQSANALNPAAAAIAFVSAAVDTEKLSMQAPPVPSFTPPAPPSAHSIDLSPVSSEISTPLQQSDAPRALALDESAVDGVFSLAEQQARNIALPLPSEDAYLEALAQLSLESATAAASAVSPTAPFDSGGGVARFDVSSPGRSHAALAPHAASQLFSSARDRYIVPLSRVADSRQIQLPEPSFSLDAAYVELEMPPPRPSSASPHPHPHANRWTRSPTQPRYSRTSLSPSRSSPAQVPAQHQHRLAQSVQTLQALSRSLPLTQSHFVRPLSMQSAAVAAVTAPRAAAAGSSPEQTHRRVLGRRN